MKQHEILERTADSFFEWLDNLSGLKSSTHNECEQFGCTFSISYLCILDFMAVRSVIILNDQLQFNGFYYSV